MIGYPVPDSFEEPRWPETVRSSRASLVKLCPATLADQDADLVSEVGVLEPARPDDVDTVRSIEHEALIAATDLYKSPFVVAA